MARSTKKTKKPLRASKPVDAPHKPSLRARVVSGLTGALAPETIAHLGDAKCPDLKTWLHVVVDAAKSEEHDKLKPAAPRQSKTLVGPIAPGAPAEDAYRRSDRIALGKIGDENPAFHPSLIRLIAETAGENCDDPGVIGRATMTTAADELEVVGDALTATDTPSEQTINTVFNIARRLRAMSQLLYRADRAQGPLTARTRAPDPREAAGRVLLLPGVISQATVYDRLLLIVKHLGATVWRFPATERHSDNQWHPTVHRIYIRNDIPQGEVEEGIASLLAFVLSDRERYVDGVSDEWRATFAAALLDRASEAAPEATAIQQVAEAS